MPTLTRQKDVFILDLGDGENRLTLDWMDQVNKALNEVEAAASPSALVTAARGKFFSNGADLEWAEAHPAAVHEYTAALEKLLERFLTLPTITVAAIQGHAFGAGALLTLAHDFRIMRADRGFWCLPEVDIDIPFTYGFSTLIATRLPAHTAHTAAVTGRRYGGREALAAGIVDATASRQSVHASAIELATPLTGKAGPTLAAIKNQMYRSVKDGLRDTPPNSTRTICDES